MALGKSTNIHSIVQHKRIFPLFNSVHFLWMHEKQQDPELTFRCPLFSTFLLRAASLWRQLLTKNATSIHRRRQRIPVTRLLFSLIWPLVVFNRVPFNRVPFSLQNLRSSLYHLFSCNYSQVPTAMQNVTMIFLLYDLVNFISLRPYTWTVQVFIA